MGKGDQEKRGGGGWGGLRVWEILFSVWGPVFSVEGSEEEERLSSRNKRLSRRWHNSKIERFVFFLCVSENEFHIHGNIVPTEKFFLEQI